jgi:diguanylate cyclase (GGDEF)-like protein/PAS domain S-box-containing protein
MKRVPSDLLLETVFDGIYCVDRNKGITAWNKSAERITGFEIGEVLNRCCSSNLLQHVNEDGENLCKKACPLSETMIDGQSREYNIFLHHKQGHRVPVSVRTAPVRDASGAIVGAFEVFTDNSNTMHILNELEALKKEAYLDVLTGAGNRRYGQITLQTRVYEWEHQQLPFGLIFLDIDDFKTINDSYGHKTGDEVLAMVSKTIGNLLRRQDVICRWGGDEFVAILYNVSEKDFRRVTERIRVFIQGTFVTVGADQLAVTVSVGATLAQPGDNAESILRRADDLMYLSKGAGRNKVTIG